MRLRRILLFALVFAVPVSASLVERSTSGLVAYQFDAGTHHDAPDDCPAALAAGMGFPVSWTNETRGVLVPGDDASDLFALDVDPSMVGGRFTVSILGSDAGIKLVGAVRVPDCKSTVMDPHNQPVTVLDPVPAQGEALVSLQAGRAWPCDATRWQFSVTHVKGIPAPAAVHVAWSNGVQADAALLKVKGTEAQYETRAELQHTLHSATMAIDGSWSGTFKVGAGPCGLTQGNAVFGDPAVQVGNTFEFTPIHPGLHHVAVTLDGHGVGDREVPRNVAMTCHFCVSGLDGVLGRASFTIRAT